MITAASYKYDFAGRRVSKTVYGSPDVTTKYCYDGDQVIAEYGSSGSWLRRFYYGPGIDEPVCLHVKVGGTAKLYYYHYDGLGNVVALSDVNGNVVERYEYDVFGEPTIRDANDQILNTSAYDNPYMFTGRRYDSETGLYYYRARYYAPDIGRFESVSLYNIDDLNEQISRNKEKRSDEIPKARQIVAEFTNNFSKWYDSLNLVPVISQLT